MKKEELLDKEIQSFLDSYVIEEASEEQIDETIEVLRAFVPRKKEAVPLKILYELVKNELGFISPLYWIMMILVLVSGVLMTNREGISPYIAMWAMAPVPTLLGLVEILRKNNKRVNELEMSFKYSFRELLLCRLFIVGVLSIAVDLIFGVAIKNNFSIIYWDKIVMAWLIPYTLISAVGLLLATRIRNESVVIVVSVVWVYFSLAASGRITKWMEGLRNTQSLLVVASGVVILAISYIYFCKYKINSIYSD